jgi:hypothetical protein
MSGFVMSHNHLRCKSEIPSSPAVVTLTGFNNEHVKKVPVHEDIHTRIVSLILIPCYGHPNVLFLDEFSFRFGSVRVLVENIKLLNCVINLFKFRINLQFKLS